MIALEHKMLFTSLHQGIVVSQEADGTLSWSGDYNGTSIKQAIPLNNGDRCILLLDPDASKRPVFENLLCIDRTGALIWTAKLPGYPDVFLDAALSTEGLLTHTWSGMNILLNENTGDELKRNFAK